MARDVEGLIGRDRDVERVRTALESSPVVTIVGPGGMGKTALARLLAAERRSAGDDVWFVDLAAAGDEAEVGAEVARTLGVTAGPGDPTGAVFSFLARRAPLLILDNLEEVRAAGAWVDDLIEVAPGVRVLATSRRPTGARSEHEVALAGLALPAEPTPAAVAASPAGALYLSRARAVGRMPPLDRDGAAALELLLRRLDGLPLAIELAAGRSRILSPGAITAHLDDPELLASLAVGGDRGRHASLDAVLAWSVSLLQADHARLLGALAICPSSFGLDLAAAVMPGVSTVAALDAMVATGLVAIDADAEDRFRLLETVRSHVRRTVDPEFSAAVRVRHAARMAALADELEELLWQGEQQADAIGRVELDHDNFAAAIEWGIVHDPAQALQTAVALSRYWVTQPDLSAPIRWLRRLLVAAGPEHPAWPTGIATLIRLVTRHEGGPAALELASDAASAMDRVEPGQARRLLCSSLALVHYALGDLEAVGHWLSRAAEASGDDDLAASFSGAAQSSIARSHGDYEAALRALQDAGAADRRRGDRLNQATQLISVALLELRLARPERAVTAARESTELNPRGHLAASAWDALAMALSEIGDVDAAHAAVAAAWKLAERGGLAERIDVLEAAVPMLVQRGDDELAVRALASATTARPSSGWVRMPEIDWLLGRYARRLRRRLGEARYAIVEADGGGAPIDAMVERVVALPPAGPIRPAAGAGRPRAVDELTAREVEVLALVGEGRSDREIAEALVISAKTASVYVARIKGKLGATSRVDLALRARSLGLTAG